MRLLTHNLLIALVALQLTLMALGGVSAGFDFFKKKDKKTEVVSGKGIQNEAAEAPQVDGQKDQEEIDELPSPPPAKSSALSRSKDRDNLVNAALNAVRGGQTAAANQDFSGASGAPSKRPDLDKVRQAVNEQARIASQVPKRPSYNNGGDHIVQGRGRRRNQRREAEEAERRAAEEAAGEFEGGQGQEEYDEENEDDDDDDDDENEGANGDSQQNANGGGRNVADRFRDKKVRDQANRKFVSTLPKGQQPGGKVDPHKPNLSFLKPAVVARKAEGGAGGGANSPISGEIKKNKLITSSYWSKKINSAYKVTKNGIKESVKIVAELPKTIERGMDSINAFLQLDSKGKILALIDEAAGDAHFVRKEFSQFTLSWSPVMERALDYLGDSGLDKIKWNDKDELDHRKDALYSLAFGYEFMRLMIVWRENLLVAHEAFKLWLDSVKTEVEQKRLEVDESLVIQLRTTHTYMLLTTWSDIDLAANEARTKLDYLMEVLDDRPKNYECEFFRNIVVLQEMYDPTVEEFDHERNQVASSISESGVVVENLKDVDEFFTSFRNSLAESEFADIDWEVPKELTDFMAKLEPQLRRSSLIYPKAFLSELGLRK